MIYLADFSVIKPAVGLFFWSTIFFLLFWLIIGKTAFKPIMNSLRNREKGIADALNAADEAKKEMAALKAENEEILKQAREERSLILKEASDVKDRIIKEAKTKAKDEANAIMANAKVEIENEKQNALTEVKNSVGNMALSIAEQVLRKDLSGDQEHEQFVKRVIGEMNEN